MKRIILLIALFYALLLSSMLNYAATVPDGVIVNGQASATVTWTPPATRTDGSALSPDELGGFVIYWSAGGRFLADGVTYRDGCSSKADLARDSVTCYTNAFDLADGSSITHSLSMTLDQDTTLFFTVAAYDVDGNWSGYSNEIAEVFTVETQTIDPAPPLLDSVEWDINCTTNKASVTCIFTVSGPQQ